MNMLVRLSRGRDAEKCPPFMVFLNRDRNYPIRDTPEDVPGMAFHTGPKGCMDTKVLPQWISERRVIGLLPHNRRQIIFLGNCSGKN